MMNALIRALVRREVRPPGPIPADVCLRRGRVVPVLGGLLAGMRRPAAAVTLGRTIIVHPSVTPSARLLRHELEHVRQWRRNPIAFPLRYTWNHLRYGYEANPFEVQARQAE